MCIFLVISSLEVNKPDIRKVSKKIAIALSDIPNPEVKWEEFATKLCGTKSRCSIAEIKRKPDFADRCMFLLNYWSVHKAEGWDRLISVLSEVDLNAPANELQKAISSLQSRNSSGHNSDEQLEQGSKPARMLV